MIVTVSWMEEWFRRFDVAYFGGKLPLPELALSRAKTRLGQLAFKRSVCWGRIKLYDFKLSMTTYYDMTDMQAKSVLLHEMIHYVIAYTGLKDTSPHGVVFRGMMDNLNRKHGWQIRTMTDTRGWKKAAGEKAPARKGDTPERYLVLAVETTDGRCFLSRVNPAYAHRLDAMAARASEVKHHCWYTTCDTAFADYPQVRSLRGRRISRADFARLQNVMERVENI